MKYVGETICHSSYYHIVKFVVDLSKFENVFIKVTSNREKSQVMRAHVFEMLIHGKKRII